MKRAVGVLLLCGVILLTAVAFAKNKPTILVEVVKSENSTRQITNVRPGVSDTDCDTRGTVSNDTLKAVTSCTTSTTPPKTEVTTIAQKNVFVVLPDGNHVKFWCQSGYRRCEYLWPGTYTAEWKSSSALLIYVKQRKIKYVAAGGF